jgi:hypothetical protein
MSTTVQAPPLNITPITNNNIAIATVAASISKSEYDSLAPLNLPSKPIVYMQEQANKQAASSPSQSLENLQITNEQIKADEARQDEKSKLESILLNSMNASSSSSGSYCTTNQLKSDGQVLVTAASMSMMQQQQMNNIRFAGSLNNWPPRMMNMQQIRPQQPMQLRPTYICTICKKPGHPKSLCPEAGTLPKPEERPKFPSGIPKNKMRVARPDDKFAMLGPDGYVVPEIEYQVAQTVKKDKTPFLTEEEEEEEKRKNLELSANGTNGLDSFNKYPPELKCPFGDHIIKDAVLIPCCGHFICCDECIKKKITNDEYVECPHKDCDQEIGSLESITPYHDIRKRVNEYLNDLKFANQRSTNFNVKVVNTTNDVFLDLLLNDVKDETTNNDEDFKYNEKMESPNNEEFSEKITDGTPHSPLQDSKISSSEVAAAALVKQNLNEKTNSDQNEEMKPVQNDLPPHQQPALLPTPQLIDNKPIQQPTHLINGNIPTNMRVGPIFGQNEMQLQHGPTNSYMIQQRNNAM